MGENSLIFWYIIRDINMGNTSLVVSLEMLTFIFYIN